jgi:hypothetical protein
VFSLSDATEVERFVAREEELAMIHNELGRGSGRRTAVVHGLGGMGKTQLAVAYATHHRDDYSAVFWLNARDETSLKQSFASAAKRILSEYPEVPYLKNAIDSQEPGVEVGAVKRWLDRRKNHGWLMIYDNYDNPKLKENGKAKQTEELDEGEDGDADTVTANAYDIKPFLPDAHHGAVLITSRSSRVNGKRIPLGKLRDLKDSLEVLSQTSGRAGLYEGIVSSEDPHDIWLMEL